MGLGVSNGNNKVSILLYADDVAIVSENEINLQLILNRLYEWCQSWFCLLFVYLGFNVAFNTVQVISRRVVGRAEETST